MKPLCLKGVLGDSDGKESARRAGDPGSIPGSGRSLRERHGNPLQDSCLENSMDRGVCGQLQSMGSQRDTTERLTLHFLCLRILKSEAYPHRNHPIGLMRGLNNLTSSVQLNKCFCNIH